DYPAGQIYDQSVQQGITVKENRTVKIKISDGITTIKMPDLAGKSVADAEQILFEMGMDYTVRTQNEDKIPADEVIKTDPEKDTKVEKNQQIILYVSRGPEQTSSKVPSVIGKDVQTATERLQAVGLVVSTVEIDSDQAVGTVVTQNLPSDQYAKKGDKITLEVSNGSKYYKPVKLAVDFPKNAKSRDYKLVVYINGEDVGSATVNPAKSSTWNIDVKGNGVQKVILSLDGVKYAEFEVNFDTGSTNQTQGYFNEVIEQESSSESAASGASGPSNAPTPGA
ncbi:MAG: PASTA domain-containing protein, partial [Oscillospiraceae bacterium]